MSFCHQLNSSFPIMCPYDGNWATTLGLPITPVTASLYSEGTLPISLLVSHSILIFTAFLFILISLIFMRRFRLNMTSKTPSTFIIFYLLVGVRSVVVVVFFVFYTDFLPILCWIMEYFYSILPFSLSLAFLVLSRAAFSQEDLLESQHFASTSSIPTSPIDALDGAPLLPSRKDIRHRSLCLRMVFGWKLYLFLLCGGALVCQALYQWLHIGALMIAAVALNLVLRVLLFMILFRFVACMSCCRCAHCCAPLHRDVTIDGTWDPCPLGRHLVRPADGRAGGEPGLFFVASLVNHRRLERQVLLATVRHINSVQEAKKNPERLPS
ncbi:hypothetical protein PAPYR_613 [Paratrimastix pyriformis]|uniref:Uncharacterized protein n=1 Tax=Paratrimastix pyriformis TaxID=342808 RepID=A0ABQ8UYH1_9EUKA|nr:hypothetical protein PAPYR_613 [Paratrimastix pyriformis]